MLIRALILLLALPAPIAAGAAARNRQTAGPVVLAPAPAPNRVEHAPACYQTFDDTGVPRGIYFPAGAGVEVLDDLHLGAIRVNTLCAFDLGYFKSGPGTTDATVTIYRNDLIDNPPGPALASFFLPGLPTGENAFHVEAPGAILTQEVWLGVSFSTADAGLQCADPAWPGTTDDVMFMRPPNDFFNFGGNPRANFLLAAYATGTVVSVGSGGGAGLRTGFVDYPSPSPSVAGVGFRFSAPLGGMARVEILDVTGRRVALVANRRFEPGIHRISWDGRTGSGLRAAAGVYLVRLTLPGFAGTRKIVLVR